MLTAYVGHLFKPLNLVRLTVENTEVQEFSNLPKSYKVEKSTYLLTERALPHKSLLGLPHFTLRLRPLS